MSFAGAGACLLGVLMLLFFLVRSIRRGPGALERRDPSSSLEETVEKDAA